MTTDSPALNDHDYCPVCKQEYESALESDNPQSSDAVEEIYYCARPEGTDQEWEVFLHR